MPTNFAVRRVRGPAWNATVPLRDQALWAEHAAFMNALAAGGSASTAAAARLLVVKSVQPWTVLLEGRAGPQAPHK